MYWNICEHYPHCLEPPLHHPFASSSCIARVLSLLHPTISINRYAVHILPVDSSSPSHSIPLYLPHVLTHLAFLPVFPTPSPPSPPPPATSSELDRRHPRPSQLYVTFVTTRRHVSWPCLLVGRCLCRHPRHSINHNGSTVSHRKKMNRFTSPR